MAIRAQVVGRAMLLLALLVTSALNPAVPASPAAARPVAASLPRGTCPNPARATAPRLAHGALAMYCVPANWNGDLVVWAHGYVDVTQPVGFYHLNLADATGGTIYLPDLVQVLGFAFATTSFRTNGLAILQGVEDVEELVDGFTAATGKSRPHRTYQVGASEGGLISTLLAERSPERFSGALAACGPIGNFAWQIGYVGDMRVLFDYFYPGVLPDTPVVIPQQLIDNWESKFKPAVHNAILADPNKARQMYRMLLAPVDLAPLQLDTTATDVLWYNVFGTNDARQKLGGNPYDNTRRWYVGSDNDFAANQGVRRFSADPKAVANVAAYETSGRSTIPLVTLHTTGDDIIPYWHELLYFFKLSSASSGRVVQIPVDAYGHCKFTLDQLLGAFGLLVLQVGGQRLPDVRLDSVRIEQMF